ncbi:MAG: agmatine deiminase family protein, partial [Prevotella sp.]|nr:agmatine deiminase family protein [Prevotella sp.]
MSGSQFYLPAEWREQCFVLLAWPDEHTDWKPYLAEIRRTVITLIEAITRFEDVVLIARDGDDARRKIERELPAGRMKRVKTVSVPLNDTWARDYGPVTLLFRETSEKVILDFRFNGWGEKYPAGDDNRVTRLLCEKGIIKGRYADNDDFILEGGSIESDGRGTIFTTSQCLLAPHRNAGMSRAEIEEQLKRRLCAQRIVWLNHGRLIGDDTDGHIDTIVRVCPGNILLYVQCTDKTDPQYADFKALEEELQALRNPDGEPYVLIPLPMPRPMCYDGARLPATYANFLVINGAVIVPVYGQKDLDDYACRTIGSAFPDREIIPVDASVIIRQGGSIHC